MTGQIFPFEGKWPRVHPSAFIAPTAVLIGDVEVGPEASVWYHCVLRGDTNVIRVGARSNIQDGTIVHVNSGRATDDNFATIIGEDVTIGHACIIHACTLKDRAFIGMGASVLDGAVVQEGGMLAAGSLLPPGKVIGLGEQWMGNPAKLRKPLTEAEAALFARTAPHYVELGKRHTASLG